MRHLAPAHRRARHAAVNAAAILGALLLSASAILATPRAAAAAPPATEVFARVAPAVPVVETELGHGTGFMLDARHVLTAAHVVQDFEIVKVRFPGGATYGTSKVVARDWQLDMAVIEIPGTRDVMLEFAAPPEVVGAELYALGYPGRTEKSDQPILSRGLVSQVLRWETLGITYLRTDASGAPGASGGPILDAEGRVVAMIQFGSPTGAYMVGAAATTLKARALRLLAGEDIDGIARRTPGGSAGRGFAIDATGIAQPDNSFFVVPAANTEIEIKVTASGRKAPVSVSLQSAIGDWVDGLVLTGERKSGTLNGELKAGKRYWLSVVSESPAAVEVQSSVTLTRFADPDDGRVAPGRVFGLIDHGNDVDCRTIALRGGQQVTALAESATTDVSVYLVSPNGVVIGADSDGGDGVRGGDAELTRKVASDGDFTLCIASEVPVQEPSGYVLSVSTTPLPSIGSASGTFSTVAATLATARRSNTTVGLLDGRALTVGGLDANDRPLDTAEVYDAKSGTVQPAGRDTVARRDASAAVLLDGRVLVVGGATAEGVTDAASLFDPKTGAWTAVGPMNIPRIGAEAITLEDGRVLIASGSDRFTPTAAAELFDPATGRFTATGAMTTPRSGLFATRLQDGRVLFAGGMGLTQRIAGSAELYDPKTGRFTRTGSLSTPRFNHNSTLLPDGKVLITGGSTPWEEIATAELYDPETGRFTETGKMAFPRQGHVSALLPNGRVLIASGAYLGGITRSFAVEVGAAELYDPATGTFLPAGSLRAARGQFGALLADGTVAFLGGATEDGPVDSIEVYTPGPATTISGDGRFATPPSFSDRGVAFVVFGGGSVEQLEAAAHAAGARGVWVQDRTGAPRLLVVSGPTALIEAFRAAFIDGLPSSTPATLVR